MNCRAKLGYGAGEAAATTNRTRPAETGQTPPAGKRPFDVATGKTD